MSSHGGGGGDGDGDGGGGYINGGLGGERSGGGGGEREQTPQLNRHKSVIGRLLQLLFLS